MVIIETITTKSLRLLYYNVQYGKVENNNLEKNMNINNMKKAH